MGRLHVRVLVSCAVGVFATACRTTDNSSVALEDEVNTEIPEEAREEGSPGSSEISCRGTVVQTRFLMDPLVDQYGQSEKQFSDQYSLRLSSGKEITFTVSGDISDERSVQVQAGSAAFGAPTTGELSEEELGAATQCQADTEPPTSMALTNQVCEAQGQAWLSATRAVNTVAPGFIPSVYNPSLLLGVGPAYLRAKAVEDEASRNLMRCLCDAAGVRADRLNLYWRGRMQSHYPGQTGWWSCPTGTAGAGQWF